MHYRRWSELTMPSHGHEVVRNDVSYHDKIVHQLAGERPMQQGSEEERTAKAVISEIETVQRGGKTHQIVHFVTGSG